MVRNILFILVVGLGGVAVLLWLGFWQLERLTWKEGILAEIDSRLAAAAVPLPDAPKEATDEYRAVMLTGQAVDAELHVLTSGTAAGTGFRVISAFETDTGRRIMLDQGLLPQEAKDAPASFGPPTTLDGNLIWPDDVNSSTPEPDLANNFWFGRDVVAMAEVLDTEPVMVVARTTPDPRLTALPIGTIGIKNDHLNYAITWFMLASVWAIMSGFLLYRLTRRTV
jgi:surfeit locus 1 family protein